MQSSCKSFFILYRIKFLFVNGFRQNTILRQFVQVISCFDITKWLRYKNKNCIVYPIVKPIGFSLHLTSSNLAITKKFVMTVGRLATFVLAA